MRFLVSLLCGLGLLGAAEPRRHFQILGDEPGAWPRILSSIGFTEGTGERAVCVIRSQSGRADVNWRERVQNGTLLILEGESPVAASFGFLPTEARVGVTSVIDERAPKLPIIWEQRADVPLTTLPEEARVFARERWQGAPLLAGFSLGQGAVLWLATSPGPQGYERYPYLLQAAADLGLTPPVRSARTWAFFDRSYRLRVDLDYVAERWQRAGISALHVAAWHHFESDPQGDDYLRRLIRACHQRGILVYAWLELPHVSEAFWEAHPGWREQTALQQDAQLDWRKLMNLANPDCAKAVASGVEQLLDRFDWDGVNLAELYYESLEGAANPSRFTPLNTDVRKQFQGRHGFDPLTLFQAGAPDAARLRTFLDFRADLARQLQETWIGEIQRARRRHADLELVLTHVDDRYDTRMRDLIGADAARVLPMLGQADFTFLIEDPATVWHLGPERYPQIAERYRPLTPRQDRLAIDLNIVDRYQDVYPTKQQTGVELFELVHRAAQSFPRVMLYFENSLLPADLPLLPAALAVVQRMEQQGDKLVVESPRGVGVPWTGAATVDGRPWPVSDGKTVWLSPGAHVIGHAEAAPAYPLRRLNAELVTAVALPDGIEFSYTSSARALATVEQVPANVEIDGAIVTVPVLPGPDGPVLFLPRGQHVVTLRAVAPLK